MIQSSSPRVVLDASAAVALFVDAGPAGQWVDAAVRDAALYAPELMPFEASNILRRHILAGVLDATAAALAHLDLVDLPIGLYPYAALSERVWQLRENLTVYDAAYVALAESLGASLVTLDRKLAHASGPRCSILSNPKD